MVENELEDIFNDDTFEDKKNYKDYQKFTDLGGYLKK